MTYKDQFVAEVKVNGKILRVRNDEVFLPFGSEYTLLLKNLNSKRASVKVSIDGSDVLDGHSVVVGPNQTVELEGFLRGNAAKNRFRFINKSREIQEHRGDKIEDGLIRIEFAFEENNPLFDITHHHYYYHHDYNPFGPVYRGSDFTFGSYNVGSSGARGLSGDISTASVGSATSKGIGEVNAFYSSVQENSAPLADEGITVKGSEINQSFTYTSMGRLTESSVIVIKLRGDTQTGTQVTVPLTVERKLECKTCGRKSSSNSKFCSNCGTFLE
jgi:hypothetical protein